jgi:hypothetical protein
MPNYYGNGTIRITRLGPQLLSSFKAIRRALSLVTV